MDVAVETVKTGGKVVEIMDLAGKHKYGAGAGFGGQAAGGAQGVEASTMTAGALSAVVDIVSGIVAAIKRVKAIVDLVTKKRAATGRVGGFFSVFNDKKSTSAKAESAKRSLTACWTTW